MFFSNTHWPFLHPESLQILQIHSFMSVLLLFSSPHSCSTGFRSEDRNGHSRSLVLCSVTHFCVVFEVCVWIIVRLEDPNMALYKISNRVCHLLNLYLLVFDRIHDVMCLNKMSRTSSRNIVPQHQKYSSIFMSWVRAQCSSLSPPEVTISLPPGLICLNSLHRSLITSSAVPHHHGLYILFSLECLFSLLFIFLWNRKQWLDIFMFIVTLECSKLWISMGINFRDILLIRFSRGANNCVQRAFEKTLFHNDISPHFQFLLSNERLDLCDLKKKYI